MIITINIKFSGKTLLQDFNRVKHTFMKKAVLHITTLMQYRARQVLHHLFSTNQGNDSNMTYAAGAAKINFKNLKT